MMYRAKLLPTLALVLGLVPVATNLVRLSLSLTSTKSDAETRSLVRHCPHNCAILRTAI